MDKRLSIKIRNISFLLLIPVAFIHGYNENLRFSDQGSVSAAVWLSFTERFISDGICRIAVPLFFIISGYLASESIGQSINPAKYGNLLRKRFFSLLLPYLIVSAGGIVLVLLLQSIPYSRPFFNNYAVEGSGFQKWLYVWLLSPVPFQLWFIRFLMGYFIIFPILYYAIRYLRELLIIPLFLFWANPDFYHHIGNVKILFFTITFVFCFLTGTDPAPFISTQKNELEGLFFFALGIYASVHRIPMTGNFNARLMVFVSALWLVWVAFRTGITLEIPARHYHAHFHAIGCTFSGTILAWYLYDVFARQIESWNWLRSNAGFAIGVFLFHEPLLTILKKGIVRLGGGSDMALLASFLLSPVLAFLISLLFSRLISEKYPGLYKIVTGNRNPRVLPDAS